MARKDKIIRRIDEKNDNVIAGGGEPILPAVTNIVAPNVPSVPEPENITVVSETLLRTTYVPKSLVGLTWDNPPNLLPELYQIEAAKDVNFTTGSQIFSTTTTSGVIELNTNTNYWFRVRGVVRGWYGDWGYLSNYPTVSYHTMNDTTPPGPVTGVATDWTSDDLEFTWTNPNSDNYFDARIRLYTANPGSGGTLVKEVYIPGAPGANSRWIFRLADNNQVTFGSPLTSVYYEIYARSIAHVLSATAVTGTVTKTAPSQPTGLTDTWVLDDGTFDESVTISWNPVTGASTYLVIVDGLSKLVSTPFFVYNYTQNVADHRPTLTSGDHTISYTVQARNGLLQTSPGASGTAINLPPLAANISLSTAPGFSSLYAYVTHPKNILDLHHYTWTLSSGSATVSRVISDTPEITFASLNGTYTLQVTATDMFGRTSNAVTVSGIALDGLTITQLRAETQYTNSIGTSPTTLNGLKDNDLLTSVVTIASGTAWKWTKAERPLLDRYRTVTLAVSGAATNLPVVYFGISSDDSTYRWFAGPLSATGTTGQTTTLTEHASEVIAQASGVLLTTNINRFDFPSIVEGRFVKMGHRGNIHNLAEYYPRRLLQSDDIEAETIKGINIAASTITADKISVISLAAITIWTGALTVSGVISIHTNGGIYQGTGTFSSPTTGLKVYNTSGIGRLTTFSGGTTQVDLNTTGQLTAGAGNVVLDSAGIAIKLSTGFNQINALTYFNTALQKIADLRGLYTGTFGQVQLRAYQSPATTTETDIVAEGGSSNASIQLFGGTTNPTTTIQYNGPGGHTFTGGNLSSDSLFFPSSSTSGYGGNTQTVANNGIVAVGTNDFAILFLHAQGNGAIFYLNGTNHTTNEINDVGGIYSVTAGTANSINVYWSAGNSRYEVQNTRGASVNIRMWYLTSA